MALTAMGVTEEEITNTANAQFAKHDVDGSGFIERGELMKVMEDVSNSITAVCIAKGQEPPPMPVDDSVIDQVLKDLGTLRWKCLQTRLTGLQPQFRVKFSLFTKSFPFIITQTPTRMANSMLQNSETSP